MNFLVQPMPPFYGLHAPFPRFSRNLVRYDQLWSPNVIISELCLSKGETWIFKWTSIYFFIHQFLYFFYYSHRHTCVFLEHANSTPVPWQHAIFWKSYSCLSISWFAQVCVIAQNTYTVLLVSPGTFGKMAILIILCSTQSCCWLSKQTSQGFRACLKVKKIK